MSIYDFPVTAVHGTLVIRTQCIDCGKVTPVSIPDDGGYGRWQNGAHIQHAMPSLSPADRERFISGICPTCWDAMFPPDFDEDAFLGRK